jgi:hypothetical protein
VALAWAVGVLACIVDDQGLPCRGDCECPSGQVCNRRVCTDAKSAPATPAAGNQDGPCHGDRTCVDTLVCVNDACGTGFCRQACQSNINQDQCPRGQVCVSRTVGTDGGVPWDGGVLLGEGVCVP